MSLQVQSCGAVVFGFLFGSVSVGAGPTVQRMEKYCHMQPIQGKASDTKLHALPDFLIFCA